MQTRHAIAVLGGVPLGAAASAGLAGDRPVLAVLAAAVVIPIAILAVLRLAFLAERSLVHAGLLGVQITSRPTAFAVGVFTETAGRTPVGGHTAFAPGAGLERIKTTALQSWQRTPDPGGRIGVYELTPASNRPFLPRHPDEQQLLAWVDHDGWHEAVADLAHRPSIHQRPTVGHSSPD